MKYKLTIDGKTQIVEIEELEEEPGLAARLERMDLRADDMAGNINQIDAQLGQALMQLAAIQKRLDAQSANP